MTRTIQPSHVVSPITLKRVATEGVVWPELVRQMERAVENAQTRLRLLGFAEILIIDDPAPDHWSPPVDPQELVSTSLSRPWLEGRS